MSVPRPVGTQTNWSPHERGDHTVDIPGQPRLRVPCTTKSPGTSRATPGVNCGWRRGDVDGFLYPLLPDVLHRGASPAPAGAHLGPRDAGALAQERHLGIPVGFGVIFAISGMIAVNNALIAYSMRRMSVSRAFGYSYLIIYSLSAVPGMILLNVALIVGTLRPDRDPEAIGWLYDFAFLSFDGTMGVFLIGSLIWMVAILLDKNRVFPKWFGYLNLCNALTEVVVAPCWIFRRGVFAWDGEIAWWLDMVVFGIYQVTFIVMLFQMIRRDDLGTGPLPDLPRKKGGIYYTFFAFL